MGAADFRKREAPVFHYLLRNEKTRQKQVRRLCRIHQLARLIGVQIASAVGSTDRDRAATRAMLPVDNLSRESRSLELERLRR